jgi:SAM-dependent methyltransferase
MSLNYFGERFMPGMQGEGATEHLHRYILARQLAAGRTILDVACGEGYGTFLLAQMADKVIGIDIDVETVAHAKKKYQAKNLEFHQGDCAQLPLDAACVDFVVSFETIEHHDQHAEMLREIRRALRPDGILLISSPNRPEFNRDRTQPYPFHVKELDFGELNNLLRAEFCNVEFYAQRFLSGSMVVPIDVKDSSFEDFNQGEQGAPGLSHPVYFLALASNGVLPKLDTSIFENHRASEFLNSAPPVRELRVYIAGEGDSGYDQTRSLGVSYPENGARQSIKLSLLTTSPLRKMRLDLSNRQSAILLHGISLQQCGGDSVWEWDGSASVFNNISGLSIRFTADGLLFLCCNDDPQFDVTLPRDVLAVLSSGANLVVDLTPRPLAEVLAEVLSKDEHTIAELRADLIGSSSITNRTFDADPHQSSLHLASDLENLVGLLNRDFSRRDQLIAQQAVQLNKMREELIRAEAQLNLLKDVMLEGRYGDRL